MQDPGFEHPSFARNAEPRCAVMLLLDHSGSMLEQGPSTTGEERPIDALNAGMHTFAEQLMADPLARKRCEISVVSFASDVKATPFVTADEFVPPTLVAGGVTMMGQAIETAMPMLRERKALYDQQGIGRYKPIMMLITDGLASDDLKAAGALIQAEVARGGVSFFSVMVGDTDMTELAALNPSRQPLRLKNMDFRELFVWLSQSLKSVSQSGTGDKVPLGPATWGEV